MAHKAFSDQEKKHNDKIFHVPAFLQDLGTWRKCTEFLKKISLFCVSEKSVEHGAVNRVEDQSRNSTCSGPQGVWWSKGAGLPIVSI